VVGDQTSVTTAAAALIGAPPSMDISTKMTPILNKIDDLNMRLSFLRIDVR
jgi:hypothetical protein